MNYQLLQIILVVAMVYAMSPLVQTRKVEQSVHHNHDTLQLASTAFRSGGVIPKKYTCDGADVSPPLTWDTIPKGTKNLALICDDPDAPSGTWVHWVIYNIPPAKQLLPEAVPDREIARDGTTQGKNDFGVIGYRGPCPPRGKPHRYFFKLYFLDSKLKLKPGATKQQLLQAMQGHILAGAQVVGTYKR